MVVAAAVVVGADVVAGATDVDGLVVVSAADGPGVGRAADVDTLVSSSAASSLVHAAIPASPSVNVSTILHDVVVRNSHTSRLTRTGHDDDGAAVKRRRGSAR